MFYDYEYYPAQRKTLFQGTGAELAKKIKMMLDVNFRKNLEKNAYNDFKKKYSFLNFVSSYEKLYDSLK